MEGNEDVLLRLKRVFGSDDEDAPRFQRTYTKNQVDVMFLIPDPFFTFAHADVVEMKQLLGKLRMPPEKKENQVGVSLPAVL